jgi:hypothetical protein
MHRITVAIVLTAVGGGIGVEEVVLMLLLERKIRKVTAVLAATAAKTKDQLHAKRTMLNLNEQAGGNIRISGTEMYICAIRTVTMMESSFPDKYTGS